MFNKASTLLSMLVPRTIIENKIKPALNYAGSKDDARKWVGIRVLVCSLIGMIGFLIPFSVFPLINLLFGWELVFEPRVSLALMILFFMGAFLLSVIVFYLHLSYVIDGRKKMVENILPDFLFLVGNNLKSGMAPFYAFRSAVRPEFGPLSEEIKIATQKSLGIESFSDALKNLGQRIDSKVLADTTKFFAQALRSGGHLAQLIETTAQDIKQTNKLRQELVTSTRMYSLFILFVVIAASPMLLAVSVQFLEILGTIQSKTTGFSGLATSDISSQTGFIAGTVTITPEFMKNISYAIIVTNSLLASIFIGVLGGGKIREGLKYAPLMAIVGLILFMVFSTLVGGLIGTFAL
jgi:archaellum biogenesis protein FlaJ (TadC family)